MSRGDLDLSDRDQLTLLSARDAQQTISVVVDTNGDIVARSDAAGALMSGDGALTEALDVLDRTAFAMGLRAALAAADGTPFDCIVKIGGRFEPCEARCDRLPGGKRAVFFTSVRTAGDHAIALLTDAVTLLRANAHSDDGARAVAQLVTQVRADLCIIDVNADVDDGTLRRPAFATTAACGDLAPTFLHAASIDDEASPIALAAKLGRIASLRGPEAAVIASCAPTSLLVLPLAGLHVKGALTVATVARPPLQERDRGTFGVLAHIVAAAFEQARAAAKAYATERRQTTLLQKAEVELRAAVAAVSLAAHATLSQAPADDQRKSKRHLEAIHRAASRMTATISHMAETLHATPQVASFPLTPQPAKDLVERAVDRCAGFAIEKRAPIVVECDPDLAVQCDADRASAALCAVLVHELRRARPEQQVRVAVERSGRGDIRFNVARSGERRGADESVDESLDLLTARALVTLQGGTLGVVDDGTISLWLRAA